MFSFGLLYLFCLVPFRIVLFSFILFQFHLLYFVLWYFLFWYFFALFYFVIISFELFCLALLCFILLFLPFLLCIVYNAVRGSSHCTIMRVARGCERQHCYSVHRWDNTQNIPHVYSSLSAIDKFKLFLKVFRSYCTCYSVMISILMNCSP